MLAMSSHMGNGIIHTISKEPTRMETLAKTIINYDPDKFVDLLMAELNLKPAQFMLKKDIKIRVVDNLLGVSGIDE